LSNSKQQPAIVTAHEIGAHVAKTEKRSLIQSIGSAISYAARALGHLIYESKGAHDLTNWVAHGATELANYNLIGHPAPLYGSNASPPEQQELNFQKHNEMSAERDQKHYDTKRSQDAMASRAANYEAPQPGMSL
jgi:hypothetical protein